MSSLNRHELIGRTGSDPYEKQLPNGTNQAKVNIATNNVYIKDGEKIEETDWHTVVFYGKLADVCAKYVKKGDLVYISGRNKMSKVDVAYSEKPVLFSEIIADKLVMLGTKKKTNADDAPF